MATAKSASTGYSHQKPLSFFLALVVMSIPVVYLENTGNDRYAWGYVILIVVMYAVFQYQGLSNFIAMFNKQVGG